MKSVWILSMLLSLSVAMLATVILTDVEDGWFGSRSAESTASVDSLTPGLPTAVTSMPVATCMDEAVLRQILRQELTAYSPAITVTQREDVPSVDPRGQGQPLNSAEFARIDQQTDLYISAGAISDAQMEKLQDELSRLDPVARREILSKITKAINSGALAGHF